ncbi:hypothetical protein [Sphaerochaeta halotolerans]|uniref:hypothetical protein n=1 Tax=Sphaerochaeta halotolerans TaxID=2293840 RepID=UPI001370C568|nr:hypothetical protein [Sphaerochaeta halotolerans]MXI86208.1 hypothetical protein [Sphaerochaeta halotolerans]
MKRRTTILSTASVFFIALTLFSSCGIGIPFNIESSITNKSDDIIVPEDAVLANYNVPSDNSTIENLELIKDGTGPSLMLFYTVTDLPETPEFSSAFDTKYRRSYNGINISSDDVLTVNEITLYRFSDNQGSIFKAPYYIATANSPTSPNFTLILKKTTVPESEAVYMNLVFDPTDSYAIYLSSQLYRYNAQPFETELRNVTNNRGSFPDYHLGDEPSDMYLHIYGAVNVSEGNFYNTYWTELAYLGHIKLNVDKT